MVIAKKDGLCKIAQDYIDLAMREQAAFEYRQRRFEAAKSAAEWARQLALEPKSEVAEEILTEIDLMESRIADDASISLQPRIDFAGAKYWHPVVLRLHDARRRLKSALDRQQRMKSLSA